MISKEHQKWVIKNLNEDYTRRLRECNNIIEQQRVLIKQQKELIDKLLTDTLVVPPLPSSKIALDNKHYTCIAPKNADCNKECDSCCYYARLC